MMGSSREGFDLRHEKEVELHSPTSSRMKDSFLIKNGTQSFANFIQNQNKTKLVATLADGIKKRLSGFGVNL
jgi:hypothetical protein